MRLQGTLLTTCLLLLLMTSKVNAQEQLGLRTDNYSGVIHVLLKKPLAIAFSPEALVPKLGNINQLMLLAGMMMAISGMEMSAVHVTEVENPKKNFRS